VCYRPFLVSRTIDSPFRRSRALLFRANDAVVLFLMAAWPCAAATPAPDAAGIEFFEKHIRPIFVEHCHKCHSAEAEKIKGGFLLDTRDGLLKGGDTGPALVPGDPEKSLLIKAVRYTNEDLQMPPAKGGGGKLNSKLITDLEAWVKMGAPDPRTGKVAGSKLPVASSRHWAFQPVQEPGVPAVKNKALVRTPVDNFILAKLEEKKLALSPPADKRTLLRRATFDLTGLPPTPAEAEAYLADKSPAAFAKVAAGSRGDTCAAGLLIKLPTGGCNIHPTDVGAKLLASTLVSAVRHADADDDREDSLVGATG